MYLHRPPANFNNETHRVIQIHERFDDVGTTSSLGREIERGTRPGLPREFNLTSFPILAEHRDSWQQIGSPAGRVVARIWPEDAP